MRIHITRALIILACIALSACCTVREGVIVAKRARVEMPEAYDLVDISFRCEPSVYWVQVQGKDDKGRERIKNILLFRHDWEALQVGDHWSRKGGFSPKEAGN